MKKLLTIFVALLALGLFALPAMADSDSVNVTVTVATIQTVDFTGSPGDFSNIAGSELGSDIDRTGSNDTVDYEANVSSEIVMSNSGITSALYTLWVSKDGSEGNGTTFLDTASATLGTALTGDSTINITEWRIKGLTWADGPISDTVAVTFTISNV